VKTDRKAVHEYIHTLNIDGNLTNSQEMIIFSLQLIELRIKHQII
jgi:hypothetical protein